MTNVDKKKAKIPTLRNRDISGWDGEEATCMCVTGSSSFIKKLYNNIIGDKNQCKLIQSDN
jgi:hypothetical protein